MGGIALGVAALVLALAALSGFQDELRNEILARTPQIEIELPAGSDAAAIAGDLGERPGLRDARQLVRGKGWILSGGRVQGVSLVGYEEDLPEFFPGSIDRDPGLYVGDDLAASWLLGNEDLLQIASPLPALSPSGRPMPRIRTLPVAGTFVTGRTEQQARIALPIAAAKQLLGSRYPRLVVSALDRERVLELAAILPEHLPEGSVVRTFRDLNRPLFFALKLEKVLMFVAVSLIVVVAGLALVADLALIIASKRSEIGMLEAMGATANDLRRTFLLLGGLLSGLGCSAGALIGLGAAWILDHFRLLTLPGDVYFLDYVPFRVLPGDLAAILAITLTLALGSSWWAARRAASLRPVEALSR